MNNTRLRMPNKGELKPKDKTEFNMLDRKNLTLLLILLFLIAASAGILREGRSAGVFGDSKNGDGSANFNAAPGQEINIEAILDVSGSMWGQVQGINKIVSSREILGVFLKDLPASAKIGLRTFGGDGESRLIVPLGNGKQGEIKDIIDKVRPSGKSPIGYALEQAGKDLSNATGKRYIVLITDGIDNGKVDPIAKARELKDLGIITHVVYVKNPDNAGIEILSKLADAGGGHFFTVDEKDLIAPTLALPK